MRVNATRVLDSGGAHAITGLVVDGTRAWAVGTTSTRSLCLSSLFADATNFFPWTTPKTSGLRDALVVGDRLWVVGAGGMVATTTTEEHGRTVRQWRRVDVGAGDRCLYAIARGDRGQLWFTGDSGFATRGSGGKFAEIKNRSTGRVVGLRVETTSAWLLDTNGLLQRVCADDSVTSIQFKQTINALVRTLAGTLLLVGDRGLLARSTDDGVSWHKVTIKSGESAVPSTLTLVGKHDDDIEQIIVTRTGIFAVGDRGLLLVSHDDGQSFVRLESEITGHQWSIAELANGDLLVAGDAIWKIKRLDLVELLSENVAERDPVLARLARGVIDRDDGGDLVFEDALRERELLR